jgi:hypothetical protein
MAHYRKDEGENIAEIKLSNAPAVPASNDSVRCLAVASGLRGLWKMEKVKLDWQIIKYAVGLDGITIW